MRRCRAHPAKVGSLSGVLDMRMQNFLGVFGYEDAELILPKLELSLCFWI